MKVLKREKRLLRLIYLLCLLLFVNLGFLEQPYDKFAIIMGVILCVLIGYSHFVIRRFYPDGDKFILIFASILAVIGIATLYRLDKILAIKQLVWVTLGLIGYILIVAILPDLKSFAKYK
ncbi:FtsW/RodA/SpoVE family cell cycle protein, partial [Clostridium saudiense]|nr:FtsW/RodA/SpoVE family cell cycle protein [Clostridium saudiense]